MEAQYKGKSIKEIIKLEREAWATLSPTQNAILRRAEETIEEPVTWLESIGELMKEGSHDGNRMSVDLTGMGDLLHHISNKLLTTLDEIRTVTEKVAPKDLVCEKNLFQLRIISAFHNELTAYGEDEDSES